MKEASLKRSQTKILHIRYSGKYKTIVNNKDKICSCQGLGYEEDVGFNEFF